MRVRGVLLGVAVAAVLVAACSPAAPTFEGEFDGISGVVLNNPRGSVVIDGDETTTALVTAEASFSDAEQFEVRVEGDLLVVEHDCGDDANCTVDYQLTIPQGAGVEVTTAEASAQVSDLMAGVGVTTESGDVFVRRIQGDIVVGTTSGLITGTQNRSRVASFTASGESEVSVSFDIPIDTLRIEIDRGDITAQLAGGPYSLDVETGSGSVETKIEVDTNAGRTATIRTGSGDISIFQN